MSSITSLLSSGLEDYLYTYIQTIVSMIDKVKKNKYKSTLLLRLWWSRQRICLFYTAILPSSHYEEHLYIPSFITESMSVHSSTQCIYYGIHSHQIDLQKLLFWVHLHSQRPRRKIHHQSQYKQEYNQSMLFLWTDLYRVGTYRVHSLPVLSVPSLSPGGIIPTIHNQQWPLRLIVYDIEKGMELLVSRSSSACSKRTLKWRSFVFTAISPFCSPLFRKRRGIKSLLLKTSIEFCRWSPCTTTAPLTSIRTFLETSWFVVTSTPV